LAKGYIVDQMIENLKSQGVISGLIDGRGDMCLFGEHTLTVGIQHPRDKEKIIKKIRLNNASVATSGDYNQYNNSFDNCHILDKKDLISVTVVAPSLILADVLATAIFVSSDIQRLIAVNKNAKVMTIDKDLDIKYYNKFEELLEK
jgi:FAD:protein FMN transferase